MFNTNRVCFLFLIAASLIAVHAQEIDPDNYPAYDIDHHVTPYPYNTDAEGIDLPVEIGRFNVPADRDALNSDVKIELGYIRYPADEGVSGPTIVFLSDEETPGPSRQELYAQLRKDSDVVVFYRRGYGLSSPLPPCSERLSYALNERLDRERLTDLTRAHVATCIASLRKAGILPTHYSGREAAADLGDLAQVLGLDNMVLIAEDRMTRTALAAIETIPGMLDKVVLINPRQTRPLSEGDFVSVFFQHTGDSGQPGDSVVLKNYRALSATLASEPLLTTARSESNRETQLAIGDFDLAMTTARLMRFDSRGLAVLESMLADALNSNFQELGRQVLATRQWLSTENLLEVLSGGQNQFAGPSNDYSDLSYALNWPISALTNARANGEFEAATCANADTPDAVIIGTHSRLGASPASLRAVGSRFDNAHIVSLSDAISTGEESESELTNLLMQLFSGAFDSED